MKAQKGGALILIVVMMTMTFIFAAVALNTSDYQMLATHAYAQNAGGYRMAEGGVTDAVGFLNEILFARALAVSEAAYEKIRSMDLYAPYHETDGAANLKVPVANIPADLAPELSALGGRENILFKTIFKKYMDAETRAFVESAAGAGGAFGYGYDVVMNDAHETAYAVNITIKYFNGGFDIVSAAQNKKTRVTDTAVGRATITHGEGEEILSFIDGGLTIENAGGFRYALVSVKKAFD